MKTKISISDPIFASAEALARRLGMSRNEFYSKAVEAFVSQHKYQGVTAKLNEVYASESNSLDDECYQLQQKTLAART
jgi:metal-responsive CopG/Arc/MetJ family transcriptional regulator